MPQADEVVDEVTESPQDAPETTPELVDDPESLASLHLLLIRLVGRIPDGAVAAGREALFDGRLDDLAKLLGLVVFYGHEPVSPDEEELIRSLLLEFQCDAVALTPQVVGVLQAAAQEMTVGEFDGDARVLALVKSNEDSVGLWACWSGPAFGSPWPDRVRCYVVEASSGEGALDLDRRLHEELAGSARGADEPDTRVFVIGPDGAFTPDAAVTLEAAELIWAKAPAEEIQMASVFAEIDEAGRPTGAEGEPLAGVDREAVLSYLLSAEVVLRASEPGQDILDEESGAEVPLDLRSDGFWVWSDASAYYLAEHDVRPPQGLVDRALDIGGTAASLDSVTYHRVLEALAGPAEEGSAEPEQPGPQSPASGPDDGDDSPDDGDADAARKSSKAKPSTAKSAATKPSTAKSAATKSAAAKSTKTAPAKAKAVAAESAETKSAETKSAETRAAEVKSAQAKSTAAKLSGSESAKKAAAGGSARSATKRTTSRQRPRVEVKKST
jgi:hypothetical protein